jgi:hypothetical protein
MRELSRDEAKFAAVAEAGLALPSAPERRRASMAALRRDIGVIADLAAASDVVGALRALGARDGKFLGSCPKGA